MRGKATFGVVFTVHIPVIQEIFFIDKCSKSFEFYKLYKGDIVFEAQVVRTYLH